MFIDHTINFLNLVPAIFVAIFVEKHYPAYWTSAWNCYAMGIAAVTLFFTPVFGLPAWLPLALLGYVLIVAVLGFKVESDILRFLGSSAITATILGTIVLLNAFPILLYTKAIYVMIGIYTSIRIARVGLPLIL